MQIWSRTEATTFLRITLVSFLGAFSKLRKWQFDHVCPSVRLSVRMEQLGSYVTDFYEILYLSTFSKICRENSSSLQSDENNGFFA